MDIIPVLDVRHGVVVRAQRGDRAAYAPIVTPLASTSDLVDVARGLAALHPFRRLYIADLDAIEGRPRNDDALARLREALPALELWVDNGLADETSLSAWNEFGLGRAVLGSESQSDPRLPRRVGGPLSLDYRDDAFLGPRALLEEESLWPEEVIVMTLGRVGSALGPDLDRLSSVKRRSPRTRVYAAGGVRDARDLEALAEIGIDGLLIASALHNGGVGPDDLLRFAAQ